MLPFGRKERYYNGNDAYKYIERLLKNGKNIYIVSPYIDKYYASRIKAYSSRRRFHIISSSGEKEAMDMLRKGRSPIDLAMALMAVFGVDSILYYINAFSSYLVAISVIIVAVALVSFSQSRKKNIFVMKPRGFVHAKMYISEKMAIEGSANLTYKGTHSNIEHILVTEDQKKIGELRREFWKMWDSLSE